MLCHPHLHQITYTLDPHAWKNIVRTSETTFLQHLTAPLLLVLPLANAYHLQVHDRHDVRAVFRKRQTSIQPRISPMSFDPFVHHSAWTMRHDDMHSLHPERKQWVPVRVRTSTQKDSCEKKSNSRKSRKFCLYG